MEQYHQETVEMQRFAYIFFWFLDVFSSQSKVLDGFGMFWVR